jgi:hypothetical protein
MLQWIKTAGRRRHGEDKAGAHARKRHGCNKARKYRWLYEYLEKRYANTVVLTFGQVEDLLGFSLPDLARTDQELWTVADISTAEARGRRSHCSSRTHQPPPAGSHGDIFRHDHATVIVLGHRFFSIPERMIWLSSIRPS